MHSASSQPQSRPQSRTASPGPRTEHTRAPLTQLNLDKSMSNGERSNAVQDRDQKQAAKHTLLASAANQNYQRCHRALKSLELYWEGVKYIITVLDQKNEEQDSAEEGSEEYFDFEDEKRAENEEQDSAEEGSEGYFDFEDEEGAEEA